MQMDGQAQTAQSIKASHGIRGLFHKEVICVWYPTPLTWLYDELADTTVQYTRDSDADGVLDIHDLEPGTNLLASVNAQGVALDSDGDGCYDHEDPEPMSLPGWQLSGCSRKLLNADSVFRLVDICRVGTVGNDWILPYIFFDQNISDIRSDAVRPLELIIELMQKYPALCIQIVGYTGKSEAYAQQLGLDRAVSALQFVTARGIEEDRCSLVFMSEQNAHYNPFGVSQEYWIERRVEFHIEQK